MKPLLAGGLAVLLLATACAHPAAPPVPPLAPARLSTSCERLADGGGAPGRHLSIRFSGVSTLMFDDGADRVLIDGYFSRPGALRTLLLPLASRRSHVLDGLGRSRPPLRALMVAHGHHDHALDAAAVATEASSAVVIGTPAVRTLLRARRLPETRLRAPADGGCYETGGFRIHAIHAPHGPPLPFVGSLIDRPMTRPPRGAAHFTRFDDHENLSFLVHHPAAGGVLVWPSAGVRDASALGARVVFLGLGRMTALPDDQIQAYLEGVLGPSTEIVVPIHWDAFTTGPGRPLRETPSWLDDIPGAFARLCRFTAARPGVVVLRPDMDATLRLSADRPPDLEGGWSPACPGARLASE